MSEQLERMLAGKLYDPSDAELAALRLKAHKLSRQYNNTDEDEEKLRAEILRQLTPNAKPGLFFAGTCVFRLWRVYELRAKLLCKFQLHGA